jgi:FtsH-binding integral membrane protein
LSRIRRWTPFYNFGYLRRRSFLSGSFIIQERSLQTDYYPLGYSLFAVAGLCLLLAALVAAVTTFDLWKFKPRGRSLAMTGAVILGILTLLLIFRSAFQGLEFWIAVLIVMFCFVTDVYLRQASVRSHFESKAAPERDS